MRRATSQVCAVEVAAANHSSTEAGIARSTFSPCADLLSGKASGASGLDAFDIISRLTSGSLNPLVQAGGVVRRATRFMAVGATDQLRVCPVSAV